MKPILIALAFVGLLYFLYTQFPYALSEDGDKAHLFYMSSILVFLLAGSASRFPLNKTLKYALGWLVAAALIGMAYMFREELSNNPVMAELVPHRVQMQADGSLTVQAAKGGHYYIEALVNGQPVKFMVDTGASDIVLSPKDAERVGFRRAALVFDRIYNTANGVGKGASVKIGVMQVGPILMKELPASVNEADMSHSLLGMSFLKRLKGYTVENNTLTLIP